MTRSILSGLLALVSVGVLAAVPIACQSGGVGDPCTPEAEYDATFPGFKIAQDFIESRSFQCATRICLVNHFQGRVSCPYGQADTQLTPCNGPNDTSTCGTDGKCMAAQALAPECDCNPNKAGDCASSDKCGGVTGLVCDPKLKLCTCTASATDGNGVDYFCGLADPTCKGSNCTRVLKAYYCLGAKGCQNSDLSDNKNLGKQCCVPGTDTPVTSPVCGQCDSQSHRNADDSVYCSCRCCPKCCSDMTAEEKAANPNCPTDNCGTKCDPNFNYCSCPSGFNCSEIRKNVGLGDAQLAGSYCIKENTAFTSVTVSCQVAGVKGADCQGTSVSHAGDGG